MGTGARSRDRIDPHREALRRAGMPVDAGPMQQRCLLGLLALQPNQVVGREEIVDVTGRLPEAFLV